MNRRDFLKYGLAGGITAIIAREAILQTATRDAEQAGGVSAFAGGPGGIDVLGFADRLAATQSFIDAYVQKKPGISFDLSKPADADSGWEFQEFGGAVSTPFFRWTNANGRGFGVNAGGAEFDGIVLAGGLANLMVARIGSFTGSPVTLLGYDDGGLKFTQLGDSFTRMKLLADVSIDTDPVGVGIQMLPAVAGAQITANAAGSAGAGSTGIAGSLHRHGVSLTTLAQLADVAATEDLGIATTFPRGDHRHAHGSGYLPDAHHAQLHQLAHNLSGGDALKLDDLATPDDNTDLDSLTTRHGLLPKLGGGTTNFLRADGTWAAPGGGGEANTISFMVYFSKTKTNIGTAYVDIYNALEPDELFNVINFDNFADFRIIFIWDYVGAGTQQVRWVDRANNANVLWESLTFTADQDGTDSGWVALPAWATGEKQVEWQGKSTTGTDDPIAKGFILLLR